MELSDLKRALLSLLQTDEELRSLISSISRSSELRDNEKKNSLSDSRENAGADGRTDYRRSGYNEELPEPRDRRSIALEAEVRSLREQLRQKENSLVSLKEEYLRQKQELADSVSAAQRLQVSLDALRGEADSLRTTNQQQSQELERLRQELAQRFPEGWKLFQAYHSVSQPTRELLRGVFVRGNDFTSFICGAAQSASLEKIWKTVKGCISQGNTRDADILWDIFAYAVKLVNASKPEKVYEILQAEPGMPFDLEVHALAPGSRAQGNIREIYLQGYKNVYVGRVEQKSIVSL
ncbi:MAG: hypothetical protein Q4F00_01810 [bacterium]|nr:hypothetical protein [bacterium]